MSEIVFNPEESGEVSYGSRRESVAGGSLTRLFMRWFKLPDEATANRWLLALAVVCFALSLGVWWFF